MNGDDPNAEQHLAQAWAAAGAINQSSQANNTVDQYHATAPSVSATFEASFANQPVFQSSQPPLPPMPMAQQQLPFESALPQRRRLPSYVSEPPSTLVALSLMAEEEAAAHEQAELGPSGATGTAPNSQRELKTDITLREMSWMHTSSQNPAATAATNAANAKNPVFGRSHLRTEAGDLAGAELRHRRRPPPVRLTSLTAPRSLSPSRTLKTGSVRSAGTATGNPKTRVSNIQGLVRRRDADILFAESKSDSEDDGDTKDVDRVAKGGGGGGKGEAAGSPRSDALEGKLGSEFDLEMPVTKPKRPFYRRRQFWVFAIMLSWTLAFVTAGVCLLVFKSVDDTTKLQAWRMCFFAAGLPVIWYIGDIVTHLIVWAVERSMFTVKNALYFAYAVRVSSKTFQKMHFS
jgi:hypothetical protein